MRPGIGSRTLLATLLGVVVLLTALLPAGVAGQASTRPVVIDTDLGADDIMALAWLVNEPTLDIRAITVSGTGLASCATGLDNLRALLAALDATGPEVGCGSEEPVGGGTPFPEDRRSDAAILHGLSLAPAPDAGTPARSAEEIIGGALDQTSDPLSLLMLGPATTLARVLEDPDRAVRVASVTAMVGAIEVPGNVLPAGAGEPGRAEWNAHADPEALDALLATGVPLVLVPLDAANQVPMSQTLLEGLAAGGESPSATILARLLAADPSLAEPGFYPGDPLAAVALTHPDVIETRERLLEVEREGPDAGALTVADDGLPAQVAISADRTAFELAYLAGVRAAPAMAAASPAGVLTIRGGTDTCTLDTGGASAPGPAVVDAQATDAALVAVLAGLSEGIGLADVEAFLATSSPTDDPPEWLLLAAYLEVEPGGSAEATAELTPGDYVAICITGEGDTVRSLVAPTVLTIAG